MLRLCKTSSTSAELTRRADAEEVHANEDGHVAKQRVGEDEGRVTRIARTPTTEFSREGMEGKIEMAEGIAGAESIAGVPLLECDAHSPVHSLHLHSTGSERERCGTSRRFFSSNMDEPSRAEKRMKARCGKTERL